MGLYLGQLLTLTWLPFQELDSTSSWNWQILPYHRHNTVGKMEFKVAIVIQAKWFATLYVYQPYSLDSSDKLVHNIHVLDCKYCPVVLTNRVIV